MRIFSNRPYSLAQQWWFMALLAAYAVVELSFNHRLLELSAGMLSSQGAASLNDMEIWARVVSGLGLALLLMRSLDRAIRSRVLLVLSCCAAGLLVMWHLQKSIVDAIVARADEADMHMSVQGILSTSEALKGRVELRGQPVLSAPAAADLRPVMTALWASSVLGLSSDDLEITSGAAQLTRLLTSSAPDPHQMRDAYRRAVMTPVALGASLLFGLLNLCQLFSALSVRLLSWLGWVQPSRRAGGGFLLAWAALCMAMSWWPGNDWVDSPGYSQVARPALYQDKPFLAIFVDWSVRAEPAWSDPVAWVHRHLLGSFGFQDPVRELTGSSP